MPGRSWVVTCGLCMLFAGPAAGEPVSIAVMEFSSKGGIEQAQMDALSDMLCNEIRGLGDYKVIGRTDIHAMLTLEEQRQRLSTCDDQTCLAELGGALGVRWVVVGNVSRFGKTYLLNLKMIDVANVAVAGGVSHTIAGGQEQLLTDLPGVVAELFDKASGHMKEGGEEQQPTGKTPSGSSVPDKDTAEKGTKTEEPVEPAGTDSRWSMRLTTGFSLFLVGKVDGEYSDHFTFLEHWNPGGRFSLGAGYDLTGWLTLTGRLGGYFAVTRFEGESISFGAIEPSVGLEAAFPEIAWLRPLVYLDMGFSLLMGETDADVSAMSLVIDGGLGADVDLTSTWFLGGRAGLVFCYYAGFTHDGVDKANTSAEILALSLALVSGWRF